MPLLGFGFNWTFYFSEKATVKLEIPGESGAHQRPGLNNVPLAGPCPGIDIYMIYTILVYIDRYLFRWTQR